MALTEKGEEVARRPAGTPVSKRAMVLQRERDHLRCAVQALDGFYQRVRVTHYPGSLPVPPDEEFNVNPLSWVRCKPPTPPPPPPPPPSPPVVPAVLPPCSYEKEWIELESERSIREYRRLHQMYGSYLSRGEEGLLELWKVLGGARYWRTQLRPSQLTLLLSREYRVSTLRFRCGTSGRMLMLGGEGSSMPKEGVAFPFLCMEGRKQQCESSSSTGGHIPSLHFEWKTFCSYVLPRMPALQTLTLIDFPFWPFDFTVLDKTSYSFPELKHLRLPLVKCTAEEVVEFVRRTPTLAKNGDGLWVDEPFLKAGGDNHISKSVMIAKTKKRVTVCPAMETLTI